MEDVGVNERIIFKWLLHAGMRGRRLNSPGSGLGQLELFWTQ